MEENLYWIWIARMKYLYFEVFDLLIKKYGSLSNLWQLKYEGICKSDFCNVKILNDFFNTEYKKNLNKYFEYMCKEKIKMVSCYDSSYPVKLRYINNRPIVLFYKGDISKINGESTAIVGSRNFTEYGKKSASFFAYELAKRNINIISGLALGIDSITHCSTINARGRTYAVIGNGLDNIYPRENKVLAEKIIQNNGAIISEYVVGTKPDKINFPRRNRIISGLSNSVIVVEGGKKSGSLITADFALEQGREVWAVPGSFFSKTAEGTNGLIKDGANVLTNLSDIIRC